MPEPWMADAACRGLTPIMFPERWDSTTTGAARALCDSCPVWTPCLDWAMTADAPGDGVLAGLTGAERAQLRRDTAPAREGTTSLVPPRRASITGMVVAARPPEHTWTRTQLLAASAAADG